MWCLQSSWTQIACKRSSRYNSNKTHDANVTFAVHLQFPTLLSQPPSQCSSITSPLSQHYAYSSTSLLAPIAYLPHLLLGGALTLSLWSACSSLASRLVSRAKAHLFPHSVSHNSRSRCSREATPTGRENSSPPPMYAQSLATSTLSEVYCLCPWRRHASLCESRSLSALLPYRAAWRARRVSAAKSSVPKYRTRQGGFSRL